jgi:hypothetical protein
VSSPPPQGPSLAVGFSCPDRSSLNRPHPPHSRAHRDFAAGRLIRDAFAVRERRGDPRVVPGFRCPFLPGMPPSLTPESSMIGTCPVNRSRRGPSPRSERLGALDDPAIRFRRGTYFGASRFALCCGLSGCSPPWTDLTGDCPATGGFYIQACNGLVTLPATGYHYDSHWTLLSVGLAPTGMSASLAAPDPYVLALEHTVPQIRGSLRGDKASAPCAREPTGNAGRGHGIGPRSSSEDGPGV